MAPTVYNIKDAQFRNKMIGLDYDWSLVNPKDGKTFPTNIDDWEWFSSTVPDKLKQYYEDGYMLVVFTNQSKSWKCDQIKHVMESLNIPIFVVIARVKIEYKPNIILFDTLFKNNKINKSKSFFIGDALGRKTDFADSDKIFAENIGIQYFPPEKIFMINNNNILCDISSIKLQDTPEIIIMMGFPGSGKTTIANKICNNKQYIHIKGDDYKSNTPKMLKAALDHIQSKKSIVFDATNSSLKKRKLYVDFSKKNDYSIQCIHVSTPMDISYKRNLLRQDEKKVPKIAFSVYKKYYDDPNEIEGFTLHTI
jgi:bifunctional polynucleotide phosphatase/kinase